MSYRESPIVPTVGRIVLVRGKHVDSLDPSRDLPAIVTRVWNNNTIDVQLFGTDHVDPKMTSVTFDSDPATVALWGVWRWMDYQVRTAEKAA